MFSRRECCCLKDAGHTARKAGFITEVTFDLYAVGSNSSALESRLLVERSPLSKHDFSLFQTSKCTSRGQKSGTPKCAVLLLTTRGRAHHCEELRCCSSLTNKFLFRFCLLQITSSTTHQQDNSFQPPKLCAQTSNTNTRWQRPDATVTE